MNMELEPKKGGEDAQKMDEILRRMLATPPKRESKPVKKTPNKKTGK